jgi:hypothetical protein
MFVLIKVLFLEFVVQGDDDVFDVFHIEGVFGFSFYFDLFMLFLTDFINHTMQIELLLNDLV